MLRFSTGVLGKSCFLSLLFSLVANFTWAQSETATVSGQVVDPSGLNITGAQVKLVDIDRDTSTSTTTNDSGLYTFPSVRPGRYRMAVTAVGFKVVDVTSVTVNVQDHLEQNFKLVVGSISESMTVTADAYNVNTTDATVSTVVDRNFAENLPMNGRSFETLIQLTPGVVVVQSSAADSGQFSVNGQRAASNYWTVDGVSANVAASSNANGGNGVGGTLGSFSVLGGTNSLVSVDALQEFRIQTSTYAPEFGRTPGGQISLVTRSGTNQFHASVFDYLRNDAFDANDWFNGFVNNPPLPKAEERQNDFGGTLSGPMLKDRTFFFFSYEGLRLRLPQTVLSTVPDDGTVPGGLDARQNALPALQPYLDVFPLPHGPEVLLGGQPTGAAQLNASFSNKASLDAYSIRVDHRLGDKLSVFWRYNYSPSKLLQRGSGGDALSVLQQNRITIQTATMGVTSLISPIVSNDLRLNYSRTSGSSNSHLDQFNGAVPLASLPLPAPLTEQNALFGLLISSLKEGQELAAGQQTANLQRQINVVDSASVQKGSHSLKFGVDFRQLSPRIAPSVYSQEVLFPGVPSAEIGNAEFGQTESIAPTTLSFHNLGVFAQDTWRVAPRATITYGLRWDVDFAPSSSPSIPALTGYNLNDFSHLAIAAAGTPPFKTTFGNVAPRVGLAYQLSRSQDWGAVVRAGFGVFYDLVSSETGSVIGNNGPPFSATNNTSGSFPFVPAEVAAPQIQPTGSISQFSAFNPNLKLPYTLEWNIAFEQALSRQQTVSVTYVGASGQRLLQTVAVDAPPSNPNIVFGTLVDNTATSNYNALQVQYQRRLSHGMQMLASYSWSHSIDDGSAGSAGSYSNLGVPGNFSANRGPSDFDIRDAFSAGMTYFVPNRKMSTFAGAALRGWSLESVIQARSAAPVDVSDGDFQVFNNGVFADIRPDLIPGQPIYLRGAQCAAALVQGLVPNGQPVSPCPGGLGLNPAAFADPPYDPNTLIPSRQGDTPRNFLRGFGATQVDFAIHRDFPIHESLKLQFRAEMFNILNHPNFGPPNSSFVSSAFGGPAAFGLSAQMLGQSLNNGNLGGGAFNPLYQIGGPRSMQFALKIDF
jgi:Carboxypeptidase regulatory-like domain/TonB dependent receptor